MSVAFLKPAKPIIASWDDCYLNEPAEQNLRCENGKNSFIYYLKF